MTLTNENLADLADLNSARWPYWGAAAGDLMSSETVATAATTPPSSSGAGIDVEDEQLALVAVDLSRDPAFPSIYITVGTVSNSTDYDIDDLDGQAYSYTSDSTATAAEILEGLRADINAGAVHISETLDTDGDGTVDTLRVWRVNGVAPTSSPTIDATMSVQGEATEVEVVVWLLPRGATRWRSVGNGTAYTLTRNWHELIRCSAATRCYVQVTATDGRVVTSVAPCRTEDAS